MQMKSINPTVPPTQTAFLALMRKTVYEKENFEFKPA